MKKIILATLILTTLGLNTIARAEKENIIRTNLLATTRALWRVYANPNQTEAFLALGMSRYKEDTQNRNEPQ